MRFHTFDLVKGGIRPSGKAHVIENEKFRFWPEKWSLNVVIASPVLSNSR
jgi:hypothetical protein